MNVKLSLWNQTLTQTSASNQNKTFIFPSALTNAPSSLKMADAPSRSSGAIFRLQRLRRNVSAERSFLWKFQPIREENSQPSGSPWSRLCEKKWKEIQSFVRQDYMLWNKTGIQRRKEISVLYKTFFYGTNIQIMVQYMQHYCIYFCCLKQTSTTPPAGSAALLRGLNSLLLRWMWYTFSAGTQDRGLSSGGMVTPYSQPIQCTHTHTHTILLCFNVVWIQEHIV